MRNREDRGRFLFLGARRLGEADLVVEAVTASDERLRFALRAARKGGGFLVGRFFPLGRVVGRWVRGRANRWRLVEATGEDLRFGARGDLGRTAALSALAELAARAVPEGAPCGGLYELLDRRAGEIAGGDAPAEAFRAAMVELLAALGYAPDPKRCEALRRDPGAFDAFLYEWIGRHLEIRLASRELLRAAGYDLAGKT